MQVSKYVSIHIRMYTHIMYIYIYVCKNLLYIYICTKINATHTYDEHTYLLADQKLASEPLGEVICSSNRRLPEKRLPQKRGNERMGML